MISFKKIDEKLSTDEDLKTIDKQIEEMQKKGNEDIKKLREKKFDLEQKRKALAEKRATEELAKQEIEYEKNFHEEISKNMITGKSPVKDFYCPRCLIEKNILMPVYLDYKKNYNCMMKNCNWILMKYRNFT